MTLEGEIEFVAGVILREYRALFNLNPKHFALKYLSGIKGTKIHPSDSFYRDFSFIKSPRQLVKKYLLEDTTGKARQYN